MSIGMAIVMIGLCFCFATSAVVTGLNFSGEIIITPLSSKVHYYNSQNNTSLDEVSVHIIAGHYLPLTFHPLPKYSTVSKFLPLHVSISYIMTPGTKQTKRAYSDCKAILAGASRKLKSFEGGFD